MKPRIAIPVPTSTDIGYNQRCWPEYARAVEAAGGEPVAVATTSTAAEMRALLPGIDGICLPGSPADVDPARYGAARDSSTAPADTAREAIDWTLLDAAERDDLPLLGVCFGLQSLNVWRGGTLVQDLLPMPLNHSAKAGVQVAHSVDVPVNSGLATLLGAEEAPVVGEFLHLNVNSSHHQAIGVPGAGLRVVARCREDGVVEALEAVPGSGRQSLLLGVQWHPERSVALSATSRRLFSRLVDDAGRLAQRRS